MNSIRILASLSLLLIAITSCEQGSAVLEATQERQTARQAHPNIVIIFADDMGYGDIGAYNNASRIPTPNLDRMARQGIRLTDAHSSSAVCTPSRYSLLTGNYAWRTSKKRGVLFGHSPLLVDLKTKTIPSMLREHGYRTAMIGKWHLGLGVSKPDYASAQVATKSASIPIYNAEEPGGLSPGPNAIGFDYYFGIPASLDMEPYVYVENTHLYTPLTGNEIAYSKPRREGGPGFWRKGPIGDGFAHEEVLPEMTGRAVDLIHTWAEKEQPFFLYLPLPSPHTPWLPTAAFRGKSGAGHYGDFAHQTDHVVGQVNQALEQAGIADNTLLIYTSDNGAHWLDTDIERYGHLANGHLRGQKADIYEAGHRVPFIARWPNKIPSQLISHQPTVLTDLMATIAGIVGANIASNEAIDSFDISPVLLRQANANVARAPMIHHALDGTFAIRDGDWKLIAGLGSGGFTEPKKVAPVEGQSIYRLYNLRKDLAETKNVAEENPEIVKRLVATLKEIRNGD